MRCRNCDLPVAHLADGTVYVHGSGTTADGLTFCPPDPDNWKDHRGPHVAVLCPLHDSNVKAWRGQGCGEAGWGPGHRIPAGLTVDLVDQTVAMIKWWCRESRNCSDTPEPARCASRDKCQTVS